MIKKYFPPLATRPIARAGDGSRSTSLLSRIRQEILAVAAISQAQDDVRDSNTHSNRNPNGVLPVARFDRRSFLAASTALAAGCAVRRGFAQDAAPDPKQYEATVNKAIDFLRVKGQAADGSFSKQVGIGVTALAVTGLLRHGRSPDDPTRRQRPQVPRKRPAHRRHPPPNGRLKTYETCVAVVCLEEANRGGTYDEILKKADKFLKEIPFDAAEGHDPAASISAEPATAAKDGLTSPTRLTSSTPSKPPATARMTEAIKNALVFVNRCQNLESAHNTRRSPTRSTTAASTTPLPGRGDDADKDGGLRSYGAMSYSGLKSMIFAGVKEDDPRVKAVVKWIGKNYDLKTHPGQGNSGLFYYYHTFAKALDTFGHDTIEDDKGQRTPGAKTSSKNSPAASATTAPGSTRTNNSSKATPTSAPASRCWRHVVT